MEIIVIDLRELKKLEILSFNRLSAIEHQLKKKLWENSIDQASIERGREFWLKN